MIREINKNNENSEHEDCECSTDSDINDEKKNSRKHLKKIYVCSVKDCGKEFRYKFSYRQHLRRSHKEKTLRCDHLECDYMTADKGLLKSHLILHSDERPFTCSIEGCGKTYKRKSDLNFHQISHNTKYIQCNREGCEQTFKAETYLKKHTLHKHSLTAKLYLCRTCGKCFNKMGKREYHKKVVHQKLDQPIICRIDKCNQEFEDLYRYGKHAQRCHSGQVFRCDHSGCDFVTDERNLISIHAKKHL